MQINHITGIEELGAGITRRFLLDGKVTVLASQEPTHAAIDTWIAALTETMLAAPAGQPCYILNDFSNPKVTLTPYARERAGEMHSIRTNIPIYNVFVLSKTISGHVAQLFINYFESSANNHNHVSFTIDEGVKWLEKNMAKEAKKVKATPPTP